MTRPPFEPVLRPLLRQSIAALQATLEALPEDRPRLPQYLETLDRGLQELRGAFVLVGAFAGQRLTDAMLALLGNGAPNDAAVAALDDAALLLDRCLDAEPDLPRLLAVLNALRAARAEPALSEAELFADRAMTEGWPDRLPRSAAAGTGSEDEAAAALARRELAAFQSAFLAWFRNPAADEALARIRSTAEAVAARVDDDQLRALWQGHAAFADSLIGRRVAALDSRRLLGRAVSQLKLLADHGEAAACEQTGDTLWLLVHALRAAGSPAGQDLLVRLLPARAREAVAPDTDSGSRAAAVAALQVELTAIKDAIDLRQRGRDDALADTQQRLLRAASVVDLLGAADTAQTLLQLAPAIDDAQHSTDIAVWLPLAEQLLCAEHALSAAPQEPGKAEDRSYPHPQECRDAAAALLRELLIDSALLKSGLEPGMPATHADAAAGSAGAPTRAMLLHGQSAALRLLGAEAEADAVAALERQLAMMTLEQPAQAALLVAPIAALEAWLEAQRDGSPRSAKLAAALTAEVELLCRTPPLATPPIEPPPPAANERDGDAADQLRHLFVDEAAEVLADLAALRPSWLHDPSRPDTLAALRRAFHTLKGSGRTVGADALGNLSAACELLLHRCLDRSVAPSAGVISAVEAAIQALPGLIDAWRDDRHEADAANQALIDRLAQLSAPPPATPEPDVRSVFCADSRSRLAGLRDWLARCERGTVTISIDDSLSRSFHTLKGAAAIVNAVALSRLAGMLEFALDTGQQRHRELPASALPLLEEAVQQLAWWVEAVADEQPVPDDAADRYAERIAHLHQPPPADSSAAEQDIDAELQDIFVGEAQELLDALAVSSGLWGGRADDTRSLGSLRRALHTLKGSARMAAAQAIGSVAHRLETMLERPDDRPPQVLLAAFDGGLDGLQRLLDAVKRGEPTNATAVLAAIDAALGLDGAPALAPAPTDSPGEADAAATASTPAAPPSASASPWPSLDPDSTPPDPGALPPPDAESGSPSTVLHEWLPGLFRTPDDEEPAAPSSRRESARVPVERLDAMLDQASEIAIARARLDEHHAALKTQLAETTQTIARIRDQLRQMDIETDAQISARSSHRVEQGPLAEDRYATEFDALEMDRYSRMQELSRALAESVGDLGSLHASMEEALASAESLLQQQGRQSTELQQGLMSTLMVPFSRQEQRLTRVVRQTASENGRDAEPVYIGTEAELDRNVLERMTAPLEHLLRNAVVHGIEPPDVRIAAGKPARGSIEVTLSRDGAQLVIEVADDGRGLDYPAIRAQAIARGLLSEQAEIGDAALARFILEPGFSTARRLTEDAGRGIGMDVVVNQVRQLGGTLALHAEPGRGTRFTIGLPLALAVSQALLVGIGSETFAIPLTRIEGVGRLPREQAERLLASKRPLFRSGDQDWRLCHLADFVDLPQGTAGDGRQINAVLIRLAAEHDDGDGDRQLALIVDRVLGNREIVSKGAGPQLGSVAGIGGATILADGRVAMILDLPTLVADHRRRAQRVGADARDAARIGDSRATVLVVDDSITIRRVAERLLQRQGFRVLTARDGVDAMALLHTELPDAVLLDIEMPRADGFEVAAFIRRQPRLAALPLVMITSRSGDKHRARARQLGVDHYLTKPWQDDQLLATLRSLPGFRS